MMSRKLHIGGRDVRKGWEIFNISQGDNVDHYGNANDLSRFEDNTFKTIYASHILEHFDYKDEINTVLAEWFRVLEPGGIIHISVPDLDTLARLFLAKNKLSVDARFEVMRMIFGGHMDETDYHIVGLNEDFLSGYLRFAGFVNCRRVDGFGLFQDGSMTCFGDVPISVNITAEKPIIYV